MCWAFLMLIYTRSIYMEALFCPQKKGWPSPANHQMTTAPTKFTKSRGILGWHRFGRHRFQWHLSSLSISPRFLGKKNDPRVNRDWWTEFVFFSWSYTSLRNHFSRSWRDVPLNFLFVETSFNLESTLIVDHNAKKSQSDFWLVVEPTHLQNMRPSNWIISPAIDKKTYIIWNHHLVMQKISKLESDESGTESRQRDAPSQPVKLSLFETLKKPRWATKKKKKHTNVTFHWILLGSMMGSLYWLIFIPIKTGKKWVGCHPLYIQQQITTDSDRFFRCFGLPSFISQIELGTWRGRGAFQGTCIASGEKEGHHCF